MTGDQITQLLPNLGLAGFAIWILWKMYQASQARFREKDHEMIQEIDKRDKRNEESQKIFHEYAARTQENMTRHISDNTKALVTFTNSVQENTKIMQKVNEHLLSPHNNTPMITQVNVDGKPK